MSWCDKLASTPTAGVRFNTRYIPGTELLASLGPMLDSMINGDKALFSVEKTDDFAVELITDEGFKYAADHSRMSVEFQHRLKVKHTSGGPPTIVMLSRPAPFTKLLPDVCHRLQTLAEYVVGTHPRQLDRIGIVSATSVAPDEAPPGIRRFMDYVAAPWSTRPLAEIRVTLTVPIAENEIWADRCIHVVQKPEDPDALCTLKFDWQRVFKTRKQTPPSALRALFASAQVDALAYFEDIAEGSMFDANLIANRTSQS